MAWPDIDTATSVTISGQGTRKQTEIDEDRIKLGDGYSQGAPRGINSEPRTWNVTKQVTKAEESSLDAFLRGRQGQPFTWTPPMADGDSGTVQVRCRLWTFNYFKGVIARFQGTFEEDFTTPA